MTFEVGKDCNSELVALSGDGKIAVAGGWYGPAVIWDAATGKRLHFLWGHHWGSKYGVWSMSLSADGKRLASLSHGFVTVWNVETGADAGLFADSHQ